MSFGEYIGSGSAVTKGLYHFEGNANDASGNGNNGTSANVTYSLPNGKFKQGAGFNGSSSVITLSSKIIPLGAKTINFWIKTTDTGTKYIYHEADASATDYGSVCAFAGSGYIDWFMMKGISGQYVFDLYSANGIPLGPWTMLSLTWDGTTNANMVKMYINGCLNNQTTATIAETHVQTYNTVFGNRHNSSTRWLNGQMDELIIENRQWTASEIKKLFTSGLGRF